MKRYLQLLLFFHYLSYLVTFNPRWLLHFIKLLLGLSEQIKLVVPPPLITDLFLSGYYLSP